MRIYAFFQAARQSSHRRYDARERAWHEQTGINGRPMEQVTQVAFWICDNGKKLPITTRAINKRCAHVANAKKKLIMKLCKLHNFIFINLTFLPLVGGSTFVHIQTKLT